MKKPVLFVLAFTMCAAAAAQTIWYDGFQMGLSGKVLPTENPYHRAGAAVQKAGGEDKPITMVANMDGKEHERLIYLPTYSELKVLKILKKYGIRVAR